MMISYCTSKCLVLNLIFLVTCTESLILPVFTLDQPVINLEKYIRPKLDVPSLSCKLVVFTKSNINLLSLQHPLIIIADKLPHELKLVSVCNIVLILIPPNNPKEYLAEIKPFIYKNFVNIQLVVIFLNKFESASTYQYFIQVLKKDVVLVDGGEGNNITNFNHGLTFCKQTNPKCILQKRHVRLAYSDSKPYFGYRLPTTIENFPVVNITPETIHLVGHKFTGIEFEMVKLLVENYKMRFTLYPSTFGKQESNGSWTGKFGFLSTGRVHMVLGIVPGNYKRATIGRYSAGIFMTRFTLISRRPGLLPSYQAPLRPFPFGTWIALVLSVILIGPFTYWISKRHHLIVQNTGEYKETILNVSGHFALMLISEPWRYKPIGPSIYVLAAWLMACMALQCFYSSNLIASYSIPEIQRPVITLKDSKELGKIVLVRSGSTVSLFLNENGTTANVKYVENREGNGPAALQDYNFVAARDVTLFKFRSLTDGVDLTDYYVSPKPFLNVFAGWLYSYQFKLNEPMDIIILRASAAGLIDYWFKNLFRNGSIKNQLAIKTLARDEAVARAIKSRDEPFTLHHLQALFYFWVAGLALATVIFAMELIWRRI